MTAAPTNSVASRASAADRLARLRMRLTSITAAVAFVGIAALALITTVVDGRLRHDRFETELQGRASRAAALVFFDESAGAWDASGAVDDVIAELSDAVVVYDRATGDALVQTAAVDGAIPLVEAAFVDAEEAGVSGTVVVAGRRVPAAVAPYFDEESQGDAEATEEHIAGAALVAAARAPDPDRRRLVGLVWAAAAALAAVSAVLAWLVAGRIVQPLAEQLDREEAFLATTAHELRTPLGRLRAVTESALLSARKLPGGDARDEVSDELRRLLVINDEAARSVDDLLLVGRIDAGRMTARRERLRLDTLVSDFESDVPELAVDTSGPVAVEGDPTLVRHAVSNLFTNAHRHARVAGHPLIIGARVRREGDEAVVTVVDNGPGLGGDAERVFERHHSRSATGGLGLWIARSLVERHGGTLTAGDGGSAELVELGFDPQPDVGARFELRLPAVD